MMIKAHSSLMILISNLIFASQIYSQKFENRTPFNIPLIKLGIMNDENCPGFKKIRIAINESKEYAIITRLNDYHFKNIRQGIKKTTFAERLNSMVTLTEFEVHHVNKILKSLITTLEIFEKDLQNSRWGKCLYLDAFFPRFMKGFYYFSCAVFNSHDGLPKEAKIHDSMFDVSLKSKKSDDRIGKWKNNQEQIIKLRIAIRELIFQLKKWKKNTLSKSKKQSTQEYSTSLKEAYCLFVRMYFYQ